MCMPNFRCPLVTPRAKVDENTSCILHVSNTTEVNFAHLMTGSYRSAIAGDEGEGAGGGVRIISYTYLVCLPRGLGIYHWFVSGN